MGARTSASPRLYSLRRCLLTRPLFVPQLFRHSAHCDASVTATPAAGQQLSRTTRHEPGSLKAIALTQRSLTLHSSPPRDAKCNCGIWAVAPFPDRLLVTLLGHSVQVSIRWADEVVIRLWSSTSRIYRSPSTVIVLTQLAKTEILGHRPRVSLESDRQRKTRQKCTVETSRESEAGGRHAM